MSMITDGLQMVLLPQGQSLQTNRILRHNNNNKKWQTLWFKSIMLVFKIRELAKSKLKSIEITKTIMKVIIMATLVKTLTVYLQQVI